MKIPLVLWQTAKTIDEIQGGRYPDFIMQWNAHSPEIKLQFMDDDGCAAFIQNNFDEKTFKHYMSLPLGIMRADFWRYAIIYVKGGIYADTDVWSSKDVTKLIGNRDIVLLQEQPDMPMVSNFFFAAIPKHPLLKEVIDNLIESYQEAFDPEKESLVQDYGMHVLQMAVEKYNQDLIPNEEVVQYMQHHCFGTWRESEHEYRNKRFDKPITFFTTFHQKGYELYGRTWIDTFIRNVASKSPNIRAIVYAHGAKVENNHPQVTVLDYDTEIPEHAAWKNEFIARSTFDPYVHDNTIRFSHKGFAIQKALDRITDGYAIWLDGDCVMHDASYDMFPGCLLEDGAVMACQKEDASVNSCHIESGFLLFDMDNPEVEKFKSEFKNQYTLDEIFTYGEPYDGFVVFRAVVHADIKWVDLNETYGIGGIQSDPTLTFLHPELKLHFTHNIGLTGKSQYKSWDKVKYEDKVYSQLANVTVRLHPDQEMFDRFNVAKSLLKRFK